MLVASMTLRQPGGAGSNTWRPGVAGGRRARGRRAVGGARRVVGGGQRAVGMHKWRSARQRLLNSQAQRCRGHRTDPEAPRKHRRAHPHLLVWRQGRVNGERQQLLRPPAPPRRALGQRRRAVGQQPLQPLDLLLPCFGGWRGGARVGCPRTVRSLGALREPWSTQTKHPAPEEAAAQGGPQAFPPQGRPYPPCKPPHP
jgi:hypothetical protein